MEDKVWELQVIKAGRENKKERWGEYSRGKFVKTVSERS